jgi:hypothetical protein
MRPQGLNPHERFQPSTPEPERPDRMDLSTAAPNRTNELSPRTNEPKEVHEARHTHDETNPECVGGTKAWLFGRVRPARRSADGSGDTANCGTNPGHPSPRRRITKRTQKTGLNQMLSFPGLALGRDSAGTGEERLARRRAAPL